MRIWTAIDTTQGAHQGARPSQMQSGFVVLTVTASHSPTSKTWQAASPFHLRNLNLTLDIPYIGRRYVDIALVCYPIPVPIYLASVVDFSNGNVQLAR